MEVTGCDLFTFRDGRIAIKNSYREQTGVLLERVIDEACVGAARSTAARDVPHPGDINREYGR